MSTIPTDTVPPETATLNHRIGFVGDSGVGKTTASTLLAARLGERTSVTTTGEAAHIVDQSDHEDDALGIEWAVEDCDSGVDAVDRRAGHLDTVFIVATPDTLESVEPYTERAHEHDLDCFVVVNRFQESAREELRAFDGPPFAEYIYDSEDVSTAITDGRVPVLPDWTVEAILIEALQPKRQPSDQAIAALKTGSKSVVNVEVSDQREADPLISKFETAGFPAAYFACNCGCHDGHVLARQP